ncbi:hypothetical protein [Methylocella silvestris]|uniref:Uncharacterized protein n=1 Tax=Methylocella silvestris TaxID=199596 RepID=A0A2J7TD75_METSI|nr:hypothetical protein [Methylocella silvestris]PNG24717.1 hypothetical protein CR492_17065 [Methylocella silvestris]
MLYELLLPKIISNMTKARIETVYMAEGEEVKTGKLLDLSINLGDVASQNCPPISYYRLVTREKAHLQKLIVAGGETCAPGARIAVLSDAPDDDASQTIARPLRLTVAAILWHPQMWSASQP